MAVDVWGTLEAGDVEDYDIVTLDNNKRHHSHPWSPKGGGGGEEMKFRIAESLSLSLHEC